ncbi:MAG TPA: wax ester/triacylglycerol synthase family O-acyltransferase [Acidimicrobiia bacterium]|nr:wax ester/triacylglycerol synthase family O-acyltransferase [Acidimicrobiia bacterium]
MGKYDRLTSLDASFLHMERVEYPMHVGALSVFEGAPFFDDRGQFKIAEVRDLVESRLHLLPRFRKHLQFVPYEQGRPIWVDDARFDISYHVRLTALPKPGSWEQLVTLATRVQENLLDRERPLWELWFVEGLEDGSVALIQKTHHSLIDGVSGVDVATILLDIGPDFVPVEAPAWQAEPAPSASTLLVDTLRERVTEPAEIVRSIRRAVRGPRLAASRAARTARSLSTLVNRDTFAPRLSINTRSGKHRRLGVARIPLAEVKDIRRSLGGTVNDIVLAGVGGAMSRLLQRRGDDIEGVMLRVLCPVSVRTDDEKAALGNRVSAMFVPVPLGSIDPVERLRAISASTADLKEREQAVGAEFLLGLTDFAAPTLLSLAGRVAHRQPFFNLICTNVPGPQFPLYLMGARMLEAFPIVPLTRNLTVVVGILSYDGTLHFGLFADRDACPDVEDLAAALEDSFAELAKTAAERGAAGA